MDKAERDELLRKNAEAQATLRRDINARHQRRLNGEEDFIDEPPRQTPTVTSAERGILLGDRQRPTLDEATMALWNDWLDTRVKAIIGAYIDEVSDVMGEATGKVEAGLRRDMAGLRKDLHREMNDYVRVKDREFSAEVDVMRAAMLRNNSDDLTAMKSDLLKLLRKDVVSEVLKIKKALHVDNSANVTTLRGKVGK